MRHVIVGLALLAAGLSGSSANPCHAQKSVAPDVRVAKLADIEAALARHKGRGVLINFWAIWCEPCVAELPELLATARQFRAEGGVVLTVSYDLMVPDVSSQGVLEQVRAFAAARGIDVPVFIYDAPDYDAINARFGLTGPVPATVAIDRTGKVIEVHSGKAGRAQFDAMMRKALGSGAPSR